MQRSKRSQFSNWIKVYIKIIDVVAVTETEL
jgi:hypothetical protein